MIRQTTAPVRSYPANGYGLYDMIDNAWEWTADWYGLSSIAEGKPGCCGSAKHLRATAAGSIDHNALGLPTPRRVAKGGSHLCSPDYCQRYRPAARWPQPIDTTTSHMGFRCILRV